MNNSRVLSPARVSPGGRVASALALFLALTLVGCATILPGEDKLVVRTEQTLEASLAVYDAGMTWCKANPQHLTPAAAKIAETIRTAYPPAYRSLDSALQLYKAGKRKDLLAETDEIRKLIEQLLLIVKLAGGPDLAGAKGTPVSYFGQRNSSVIQPDGYFDGCNWHTPLGNGVWSSTAMHCGTVNANNLFIPAPLRNASTLEWRQP